ncbi:hypothetical protein PENTCL1PPCAC_287 [Pristionchus entomophagus]|uniref:Uncharacterized protein n=1 Tax=Pristionchus entomophagus TaxID=358040 RepID=A0AAV5S793_9BILA|nr:hypothetical protein PENTCL1PPCAC_287 [Pristionchus entomophagus]
MCDRNVANSTNSSHPIVIILNPDSQESTEEETGSASCYETVDSVTNTAEINTADYVYFKVADGVKTKLEDPREYFYFGRRSFAQRSFAQRGIVRREKAKEVFARTEARERLLEQLAVEEDDYALSYTSDEMATVKEKIEDWIEIKEDDEVKECPYCEELINCAGNRMEHTPTAPIEIRKRFEIGRRSNGKK